MFSFSFSRKSANSESPSLDETVEFSNIALRKIGIGNYGDLETTGEAHLLRFLASKLSKKRSVVFDVGANIGSTGQYAHLFRQYFPKADIYAFEPNPSAYADLCAATIIDAKQVNEKLALGDKIGVTKHFSDPSPGKTELAGGNEVIFTEFFKIKKKPIHYEVKMNTLDNYCHRRKISKINFLKIDVEGSEYSVLQGAKKLLKDKKIDYIQFEFNIHNIYSRIFIKDFYNLLKGYHLYRLLSDRFLPMGKYSTDYEIFRYQNIFASKSKLTV
jgi:FkbM family methyltransferase